MNSRSIARALMIGMAINFACCLASSIYWGTF